MQKLPIVNSCESVVGNSLWRNLAKQGYRVHPQIHLPRVLKKKDGEYLTTEEFRYFTQASLDFVVYKCNFPVFAVEFDGPYHLSDARTEERDVIKNRLCKKADLPLLRITSTEIEEQDKITLLDFMLMRYTACLNELSDSDIDSDWDVIFDVRHPFPAIRLVADRLWNKYGIAWSRGDYRRIRTAVYTCDVASADPSQWHRDQFHTSALRVSLWPKSERQSTPIFTEIASVTIRAWLPLQTNIPLPDIWDYQDGMGSLAPWSEVMQRRAISMWFPHIPGVHPWDIADSYCAYLGLLEVERWANTYLPVLQDLATPQREP
ncbi:MAG: DUF2726 domain-containing protein [bacterium]|nr:DUF2726 domain-containing protein [bacterium]